MTVPQLEPALLGSESVLLITIHCHLLKSQYFDICLNTALLLGPLLGNITQYIIILVIQLCTNDRSERQPGETSPFIFEKEIPLKNHPLVGNIECLLSRVSSV